MSSLETLRDRASVKMTRAIENILNPDDEARAQPIQAEIPPQARQPIVDLQRQFAIDAVWQARKILDGLDINLAEAQGGQTPQYRSTLSAVKQKLVDDTYSAATCIKKARDETKSAETAERLNAAERELGAARYSIKLMASPALRILASGWFIVFVIACAVAFGVIYYALHGSNNLNVPNQNSTSLAEKTAQIPQYFRKNLDETTSVVDGITKFVESLQKLFTAIPLLIAAIGVLFAKVIPRLSK